MTNPSRKTILLATDQQQSVLTALAANRAHPIAYAPYGHRPWDNGFLSLLGFNGELPDRFTGHYHLGKGYRQFNPVLMRFNSPDSWSPFGEGGVNAYGYCGGDPKNRVDPNGHWFQTLIGKMTTYAQKTGKALKPQTIDSLKRTMSIAGGDKAIAFHAKINGIKPETNLIATTLDWHAARIERNLAKFDRLIEIDHLNTKKINRAMTKANESHDIYSNIVNSTKRKYLKGGSTALSSITEKLREYDVKISILKDNPSVFATVDYDPPPSYDQLFPTSSIVRNIRSQ